MALTSLFDPLSMNHVILRGVGVGNTQLGNSRVALRGRAPSFLLSSFSSISLLSSSPLHCLPFSFSPSLSSLPSFLDLPLKLITIPQEFSLPCSLATKLKKLLLQVLIL